MALIYTPTGWVDDDGSGTVGTLGDAAVMNNIEDGIGQVTDLLNAIAFDGIVGQNLMPEFTIPPWVSGGSGFVLTPLQTSPVRHITSDGQPIGYSLKCSVESSGAANFLASTSTVGREPSLRPNRTYTWGCWLRSDTTSRDFRLRTVFHTTANVQIVTPGGEYSALQASVVGDWILLYRTFTSPAAVAEEYVRFKPFVYCNNPGGSAGSPELVYLTEPFLVEGEAVPNFAPKPGDFLAGVDTPSAAGAANSRSVIINRSHALIDAGPLRFDIATNYDPTLNRLIDTTRGSYMLRFFVGGPRLAIAWAPATAGAPAYTEVLTVGSTGDLTARSLKPSTFTTATKPTAASVGAGAIIFVSDGAAGAKFQGSDGTNWLSLG